MFTIIAAFKMNEHKQNNEQKMDGLQGANGRERGLI